MERIECPMCGGKGLRIVWGMPTDPSAIAADPDVVSGGCCIEPDVSHECADCHQRWGLGAADHFEVLWWLESRCGVSVDHLLDSLDDQFCPTRPREPLQCPEHRSLFDGDQGVLGSPGLVVLSEHDSGTVEVAEFGTITAQPGLHVPVRVRPVLLFSDDLRGPTERADHLAQVIKDASRRRRASFRPCDSCGRKMPPEWTLDDGHCIRCVTGTDPATLTPTEPAAPDYAPISENGLWWVGDLNGFKVVAETDLPEDDTEVWLESEPDNRMTLDEFDRAQGEGVVGWLAEPEPYEAEIEEEVDWNDGPDLHQLDFGEDVGADDPVAFGAIGDDVLIRDGDNLAKWTRTGGIQPLTVTPDQYMKFNGGYMVDPDPAEAEAALAAYEADPPDFDTDDDPRVSPNFTDPDVLDMRGPHLRGKGKSKSDAGLWVIGELGGQRVVSAKKFPRHSDEVWLEYHPSQARTRDAFINAHGEDAVIWEAEPERYERRLPLIVPSSVAAEILGCSVADLDKWRRTVLPSAPRRFYGQADDEYRHEEVVAVAVGRWLRTTRQRNKKATDPFAARIALLPPTSDDWCVTRKPRSEPSIVRGTATFDMEDRTLVPLVFDPTPILDALANR